MEKEFVRNSEDSSSKMPITHLAGDEAIELWLEGASKWNAFMEKHKVVNISFEGVDFSFEALSKRLPHNKNLYKIEPSKSKRRELSNHVDEDIFINFQNFKFKGPTSFRSAKFSNVVSFGYASFYEDVDFSHAEFTSDVYMTQTTFEGNTEFFYSRFESSLDVSAARFRKSLAFFSTYFEEGLSITRSTFEGQVEFVPNEVKGGINFAESTFESRVKFFPKVPKQIDSLIFHGVTFDNIFSIRGDFNCIPDLRETKLSHHLDLSEIRVKLKRARLRKFSLVKTASEEDSECLCRLKDIAESNNYHDGALAFHADELRAKRWIKLNWLQSILDCLYSITCNYGQSVARPFLGLFLSIAIFANYSLSHKGTDNNRYKNSDIRAAITVSVATVTPFVSISKSEREAGIRKLYGNKPPENYGLVSYLHAFVSFIFIFLVGLGLRNRFRI